MTKTPDEQAWHEVFSEVRLRGGGQPKPPARFVNSELVYTIGVGYGEAGTALRLWLRDRDPDGPREAHSFRLLTAEVPLLPDPADRRLLGALGSSLERSSAARYRTEFPSRHELSPTALPLIIELLCATGRGYLSEIPGHPPSLDAKPLRWIVNAFHKRCMPPDIRSFLRS